jgi:hypothetical protein
VAAAFYPGLPKIPDVAQLARLVAGSRDAWSHVSPGGVALVRLDGSACAGVALSVWSERAFVTSGCPKLVGVPVLLRRWGIFFPT